MKKRLFSMIFIFILALALASCDSAGGKEIDDVIDTLTDAGYVLEERDAESIAYYQANNLRTTYGVSDGVVEGLYAGYINSTERWVEIVVMESVEQANALAAAIHAEGATGKLVLVKDTVVLITFSTETINLFPVFKQN